MEEGQGLRTNLCKVSVSPSNSSKGLPTSFSLTRPPHSSSAGKNLILSSPFSLPFSSLIHMLHFTILRSSAMASSSLFSGPVGDDREVGLGTPLPRSPRLIPTCSGGMSSEAVVDPSWLVPSSRATPPRRSWSQAWRGVSHTGFPLRNEELLNFSCTVWNYAGWKRGKTVQMKGEKKVQPFWLFEFEVLWRLHTDFRIQSLG